MHLSMSAVESIYNNHSYADNTDIAIEFLVPVGAPINTKA